MQTPIECQQSILGKELYDLSHCYSGCCVIADDGTPTIFYTSMNPRSLLLARARRYAQQWMATGSPDLLAWQKSPDNPILSESIHGDQIPQHWRDPYVWKEAGRWLMVLGGEALGEKSGCVYLYESPNLLDWAYVGVLAQETSVRGKGWECPNYFRLGDQYVLVVSPYGPVIYSIGEFDGQQHHAGEWYTLDHGQDFYATNTYVDDQNRTIIVGWVKAKGNGWAGCLSLPRTLKLRDDGQLSIQPIPELQKLRQSHVDYERTLETVVEEAGTGAFFGERIEIKARFELQQAQSFGFRLIDDDDEHELAFDYPAETLQAFGEQIQLQFTRGAERIDLHIFIDHSVVEIFINQREAFTTVFGPQLADTHTLKVAPFVKQAQGRFAVDFWRLAGTA